MASTTPRKPDHLETQGKSMTAIKSQISQQNQESMPSPPEDSEEACDDKLGNLKISLFQMKEQHTPNILSTEQTKRTTRQTKMTTARGQPEDVDALDGMEVE